MRRGRQVERAAVVVGARQGPQGRVQGGLRDQQPQGGAVRDAPHRPRPRHNEGLLPRGNGRGVCGGAPLAGLEVVDQVLELRAHPQPLGAVMVPQVVEVQEDVLLVELHRQLRGAPLQRLADLPLDRVVVGVPQPRADAVLPSQAVGVLSVVQTDDLLDDLRVPGRRRGVREGDRVGNAPQPQLAGPQHLHRVGMPRRLGGGACERITWRLRVPRADGFGGHGGDLRGSGLEPAVRRGARGLLLAERRGLGLQGVADLRQEGVDLRLRGLEAALRRHIDDVAVRGGPGQLHAGLHRPVAQVVGDAPAAAEVLPRRRVVVVQVVAVGLPHVQGRPVEQDPRQLHVEVRLRPP